MKTGNITLSAIQEFLIYCDTHRNVTYKDVLKLAEKYGVKVETLTRRTRQDIHNPFGAHGLMFKKFNSEGKKIKGSEPWVRMKTIGHLRTSTILKV